MKTKVLFIPISILCILAGCSGGISEKNLPQQMVSSFNAKFTSASKVKWFSENDSVYEASFVFNGREHSALFTKEGQWLETETPVITAELPLTVVQTLNNGFYNYRIKSCKQMETPSQGIFYEVLVKNDMGALEVRLNADGLILGKKEASKEKD